jgi:hypothetical protein
VSESPTRRSGAQQLRDGLVSAPARKGDLSMARWNRGFMRREGPGEIEEVK